MDELICKLRNSTNKTWLRRRLEAADRIERAESERDEWKRKAEEAARDAGRWRFVRRKVCFTGNGDGTAAVQIINLPHAERFPEIGEHERLADETIDDAIAAKGEA